MGVGWERYLCTDYEKHVPTTPIGCEHRKAICLFQVTPCSPCGSLSLEQRSDVQIS